MPGRVSGECRHLTRHPSEWHRVGVTRDGVDRGGEMVQGVREFACVARGQRPRSEFDLFTGEAVEDVGRGDCDVLVFVVDVVVQLDRVTVDQEPRSVVESRVCRVVVQLEPRRR
ncbi:hypothetical protein GS966_29200 [Rhodococcus hoagii]|nr:hypothetical protein [Prescottella equi]